MSPLITQYTEYTNVPIFTGVTALTLDSWEVEILKFRKSLWFGNRMEKY